MSDFDDECRTCFRCQRHARWKVERVAAGTYKGQRPIHDITRRWLSCGIHLHVTCDFVSEFPRTVNLAVSPYPKVNDGGSA